MKHVLHSLVLSALCLALVPAASANLFTFPTDGTQLSAGQYINVTWDPQVLRSVFGTDINATVTEQSVGVASATATTTGTANASFTAVIRRQDSNSLDVSTTASDTGNITATATTASATTSSDDSVAAASITGTNTTGTAQPAPTSSGNTTTSESNMRCVNGMPLKSDTSDGEVLLCSTLQLFRDDDLDDRLFVATNFDLSAGWLEVLIPHDASPRNEYIFVLWVRDGDSADAFGSDAFAIISSA
ncbi:hypothetical protein BV20DRAFT_378734 [Pilatotrama ljubarskyi]|nr:hypothetical protein BV20DRAFT_378734 [Pilatotrama ljubarskyi]